MNILIFSYLSAEREINSFMAKQHLRIKSKCLYLTSVFPLTGY
jgi:hypothetical protein